MHIGNAWPIDPSKVPTNDTREACSLAGKILSPMISSPGIAAATMASFTWTAVYDGYFCGEGAR